jgi:putative methionine-R-sulfoxide reductase with GAF domain
MSHYSILPPAPDPDGFGGTQPEKYRRLVEEEVGTSPSQVERLVETLAANGGGELSPDLALDLLLNEIVEQARLATAASGAAIALVKDGEMVCRATTGSTAPDLGIRLDTHSGLSGACVQTGDVQLCGDTEADSRVDALASRQLGIRSVLMVPLFEGADVLGVFEIFSSRPYAFGERDTQTLEALSRRILKDRQTAARGVVPSAPDPIEPQPEVSSAISYEPTATGANAPSLRDMLSPVTLPVSRNIELTLNEIEPDRSRRGVDLMTAVLAFMVIVASVGLGSLIGWRSGVMTRLSGEKKPLALATVPTKNVRAPRSATASPKTTVAPTPVGNHGSSTAPVPAVDSPNGDLVVYENGKEVYRMNPTALDHLEPPPAARPRDLATLDAEAGNARLVHRVDPEFPASSDSAALATPIVLNVTVGLDGVVDVVTIVSGDPAFTPAALAAVREWQYQPLVISGRNTSFQTRVTLSPKPPRS